MPRILSASVGLVLAALLSFWLGGGFDQLAAWAAGEQRGFQNQIARTLRALRGGEAGALALLLTACFAYGFFHAVGPGHGKVLLGGYGLGRRVPMLRLAVIGLASSLGQAVTAVALVYTGVLILSLGRERLTSITEDFMAPASYAAIAAIGGWLVLRGLRRAMRHRPQAQGHDHHHDHGHGHEHGHDHDHDAGACETCGHRHGPTPDEVAAAGTLREALVLIGAIAIRPCTGALFVLLITWQMGIPVAGVAGAFAMALGTAAVTIGVGMGAAGLRGGLIGGFADSRLAAQIVPVVEVLAGLVVLALAGGLLLRALS